MPVRAALNVVHAMLTKGLDAKQREEFDISLHGWDDLNDDANKALWRETGDLVSDDLADV